MSDVEMSETSIVAVESREIQLAKEWIRATKYNDDNENVFKNLFHQLLSKQVFSCFETSQTSILKASINEDKCQEKIFSVLEYFLLGEDPSSGFAKLQSHNKPPQLCGKMFKYGDPTFSCRDCGYDGTCVLCIDCFQKSIHKEHQYKMNTSGGSGFCDCGDPEAWKQGHSCELHQQTPNMEQDQENPVDKLPPELVARAEVLIETALFHVLDMIKWDKTAQLPEALEVSCNEDLFLTMLFNDEVHTYEEVISTLREAVPGCDREKALAYANTVDREGRSPVRCGNYITCEAARKIIEEGTSGPGRNPLKCKVMHHKVASHQLFAIKLLGWINRVIAHSEGLSRLLCEIAVEPVDDCDCLLDRIFQEDANLWKVARANTHAVFMNSMIMDPEGKKWFAIHFTENYKKLMDDFVADDHEHSVSATSFSVQIFTVPTLARMLVVNHDVLVVILSTFMEELEKTISDNYDTYVLHNPWFQPLRRAQYVLFDLKYLLQHKPNPWTDQLCLKFQNFLEMFLTLLKYMQGMDVVTRKTGQHIETDPEWESAFNLQIRLMPILAMVCEWCQSDEGVFRKAVHRTTTAMIEAGKKFGEIQTKDIEISGERFTVIKYDVSKSMVSIHLPVSRFLAGLLVGCHRYNIELPTLFANECKDKTLKLFLMEQSLRSLVMVAQVHSGLWRRNGYAIINQVFHYQNVKCRPEMYDKDIIMMQAAAALLDPDHFIGLLLDKFSVLDWSLQSFDEAKFDGDKLTPKLTLAEECLSLIITIIGERYTPGIGQVSSDDFFRREIIHKLCIKSMAHSELVKALPLPDFIVESEHSVDHVMASVATFKRPGLTGRGLYELKEECYTQYNPFFYHYSRIEQSKAEEEHRKRAKKNKNLEGCPPPLPPEFCLPFKNIIHLLSSKVLIGVLSTVLTRAATGTSKALNHMHIHQALHLIALALLETKRHREKGQSEEFKFIQAATNKHHGAKETLLKLLENLHDNQNVQEFSKLIEWLLKSFHDELEAIEKSNKELREKLGKSGSSSTLEDEKARKARLAQERRAKVMAQMSALQKAFIRENADLLAAMDNDRSMDEDNTSQTDSVHTNISQPVALGSHHGNQDPKASYTLESCILCQEQQEVSTKGRAVVMTAFVQRSTTLSKSRGKMFDDGENFDPLYPPADVYWGLHTSSCGHIMHSDCWQGYFDSVVAKERRALRLRQFIRLDINTREFLCPLCGCICNTVLPIIPPLALGKHESAIEDVTLHEYLNSMQDLVTSNLPVLTASQDTKAKIDNSSVPPSLAERFQALFHALTCSGSKFSTTLKDMMKVFAQSCYTIGLGVEPNDDDKRVSVMVWTACAYTIQSGESALRAEDKPLFSRFTSRQIQCIGGLTRLAAVIAGIADSNAVKLQSLRLLASLTPNVIPDVESPSLLDLDIFSLMVKLRLSMPSLQYKKEEGSQSHRPPSPDVKSVIGLESSSSMDMCSFQLCLAAQVVKILLVTSQELDSDESDLCDEETVTDNATKLASLWGKLRQWAGLPSSAPHEFPDKLARHLKSVILPFLRCSALFYHFLTEIPGPDSLKECCSVNEEWNALCHYLSVPHCLTDLLQWDQDSNTITSTAIEHAVKRWCTHEMVRKTLINAGVEKLGYSISPNQLIPLPRDYSELINRASLFTCPNSEGDESRAPVLCLICGQMLCSQSYCCQIEVSGDKVGACAAHAQNCGAGVGVFLRVRECQILLMASRSKGSFYNAPYLDTYGETDQGLRRGNPLYLCPERYNKLKKLWWSHSIAEEVAHSLESNRNLLSIDWQIL